MKRRNFLINSAAAIGGCTLFSGCSKDIKKEGQVVKRKFKDIEVSLLGLGCMRLPMEDKDKVDMVEFDKMVEYAINHGVNYFDTAYFYVNSKSENAIGEVLKKYDRESYFLADKFPINKAPIDKTRVKEDIRRIFNDQLRRCNVDYFDFYLAHGINTDCYETYKNTKLHDELLELKKEGKIKYLGFSFHGNIDMLKEIVAEGNWDFCQLQINYFDWNVMKAKEQYEIAKKAGLPVVVMEPLRGGGLTDRLSDKIAIQIKSQYPDSTPPEFGLRWAGSLDNIVTVLSGMSNLEQVKQNVAVFENFKAVTKEEKEFADKIAATFQSQGEINCTACKYCLDVCPQGVNIPAIFAIYNQYKLSNNKGVFKFMYETLSEEERAGSCIKCGQCSKNCTQGLKIPEILAKVQDDYEQIKSNQRKPMA